MLISFLFVDLDSEGKEYDPNVKPADDIAGPEFDYNEALLAGSNVKDTRSQEQTCESCHEGFDPFEVEVSMPGDIAPGEPFVYSIIVTNSDSDTEHTVEELDAVLTGIGEEPREPYNDEISGSLRRFGVNSHLFPVKLTASNVFISLSGSGGSLNRNDVDITVISPNGIEWDSSNPYMNEEVTLDSEDIEKGGYGDYTIQVNYVSGIGTISYSISIDVTYSIPELHQEGGDLGHGDSHEFIWELSLTQSELEELGGVVSGTISFLHDDDHMETYRYSLAVHSDYNGVKDYDVGISYDIELGRYAGLFNLVLLGSILLTNYSARTRDTLARFLRIKRPRLIHCYMPLMLLFIAVLHAYFLVESHYTLTQTPSLFGITAFSIFSVIVVTGFYRKPIIKKIGHKKWKRMHLILAIIVGLVVLYHALNFGNHFFG